MATLFGVGGTLSPLVLHRGCRYTPRQSYSNVSARPARGRAPRQRHLLDTENVTRHTTQSISHLYTLPRYHSQQIYRINEIYIIIQLTATFFRFVYGRILTTLLLLCV